MKTTPTVRSTDIHTFTQSTYCQELFCRESKNLAFISDRRTEILQRADEACAKSGRALDDIALMAVTKHVDIDDVILARQAGWDRFGENRPQELNRKLMGLSDLEIRDDFIFDAIGNLQTNKINSILGKCDLIHSISSLHLANAVSKRVVKAGLSQKVLLEVNISGEETKSGFSPSELQASMEELLDLEGIEIAGLMTMAPARDENRARKTFSDFREYAQKLREEFDVELPYLSGGMSDDFEIALEEGTNMVRLGRIVFNDTYKSI